MTNFPRISVLMAVYGDEPFLSETLKSLSDQSYNNFEVILTTENLSSRTQRAIDDAEIPVTQVNYSGADGLSGALNSGLKHCNGEYIARLDSDDIALPDRFKIQVSTLDSNPEIGVLGGGYVRIDKTNTPLGERYLPESHETIRWRLLLSNCIANPTTMIRRSVLEKTGIKYRPRFNAAEDYDLWSRLARETTIRNLQIPLIRYRIWDNQISQQKAKEQKSCGDDIAIREVGKINSVSFSSSDIRDMRTLLYQGGSIQSKKRIVLDHSFSLFDVFEEEMEASKEMNELEETRQDFALMVSRAVLRPPLQFACLSQLLRLFNTCSSYPIPLIRYIINSQFRER